jgi:hypothetical protein
MMAQRKGGVTIKKVKNITTNIIKCCDEEDEQKYLKFFHWKSSCKGCKILQHIINNNTTHKG